MTLSAGLQAGGIQLELLTGPLTGSATPTTWARCSSPCSPLPTDLVRQTDESDDALAQLLAQVRNGDGRRSGVVVSSWWPRASVTMGQRSRYDLLHQPASVQHMHAVAW
ncbi:hypothetical protein ACWC5I_21885 [Kitasatospora sp. NPDC001574]